MDAEGETQTSGAAQEASGPICVALTTPPWPVRRDSVGMFATRMTVQQLRRACPVAYDTVMWNDEGVSYSAVALPMPGLLIVAVQTWTSNTLDEGDARAPSPLDEHRPANLFYITGPAGQLPGGVRLTASWRELTRAYGSATMETEVSMSEVQFARLPGIFVTLDWSYPVEGRDVVLDSASAVPERTRIERVVVARTAETL